MQAVGNATDLFAGRPSHRSSNRNPARQLRRPAGMDQSRASSRLRHALGGDLPLPAERADIYSFRQLSRAEHSAPARLKGRGDVPPGPAAAIRAQIVVERAKASCSR